MLARAATSSAAVSAAVSVVPRAAAAQAAALHASAAAAAAGVSHKPTVGGRLSKRETSAVAEVARDLKKKTVTASNAPHVVAPRHHVAAEQVQTRIGSGGGGWIRSLHTSAAAARSIEADAEKLKEGVQQKAKEVVNKVKETASDVAAGARAESETTAALRSDAAHATYKAKAAVKSAGESVRETMTDDSMSVTERVKEVAEHAMEQGKRAVQRTASKVKEAASDAAEAASEKVKHVAADAKHAVQSTVAEGEHRVAAVKDAAVHKARDVKERVRDAAESAEASAGREARKLKREASSVAERTMERGKEMLEEGEHRAAEVKDAAVHKARQVKERVRDAAESAEASVERGAGELQRDASGAVQRGKHAVQSGEAKVKQAAHAAKERVALAMESEATSPGETSQHWKEVESGTRASPALGDMDLKAAVGTAAAVTGATLGKVAGKAKVAVQHAVEGVRASNVQEADAAGGTLGRMAHQAAERVKVVAQEAKSTVQDVLEHGAHGSGSGAAGKRAVGGGADLPGASFDAADGLQHAKEKYAEASHSATAAMREAVIAARKAADQSSKHKSKMIREKPDEEKLGAIPQAVANRSTAAMKGVKAAVTTLYARTPSIAQSAAEAYAAATPARKLEHEALMKKYPTAFGLPTAPPRGVKVSKPTTAEHAELSMIQRRDDELTDILGGKYPNNDASAQLK